MTEEPSLTETPPITVGGDGQRLARSASTITLLTMLSRVTGLGRVVVVGAVLGDTFLGNTYQTTNTVPNILFELIAAGVLEAVLIPPLVKYLDRNDKAEAEHIAGSVLGLSFLLLAGAALVGMAASPWISRLLFIGSDHAVRHDQVQLGTVFLLLFLPQVAMYATGMVATAVLNAHDRFASPAVAPALNNVVVVACYVAFWAMRRGQPPSLDLTPAQVLVLGGGTTFGVIAFCAVPVLSVVRSGFSLRPRFDRRHPEVRRLGRQGAWAAVFLAVENLLLLVVLLLANGIRGGVVTYQLAFTFFLLPDAIFSVAITTALFPAISRNVATETHARMARLIERGSGAIALFAGLAIVGLIGLSFLVTKVVLFGAISGGGSQDIARALIAFAPGLVGYGLFLFFSRVLYAQGDTRAPAMVHAGVFVVAALSMAISFHVVGDKWKIPALAACHSGAYTLGAIVVFFLARRRMPTTARPTLRWAVGRPLVAAAPVTALTVYLTNAFSHGSRTAALVLGAAVGAVAAALYFAAVAVVGGPKPTEMVALLRGKPAR